MWNEKIRPRKILKKNMNKSKRLQHKQEEHKFGVMLSCTMYKIHTCSFLKCFSSIIPQTIQALTEVSMFKSNRILCAKFTKHSIRTNENGVCVCVFFPL